MTATVECVRCGRSIAIGLADVVGTGYRCEACGVATELAAADGIADPDHETAQERVEKLRSARWSFRALLIATVVLTVGPAVGVGLAAGWAAGVFAGVFAAGCFNGGALVVEQYQNMRARQRGVSALPEATLRRRLPPPKG